MKVKDLVTQLLALNDPEAEIKIEGGYSTYNDEEEEVEYIEIRDNITIFKSHDNLKYYLLN